MQDQKNLFLAIGLSVAIIVIFQLLFPQQTLMNNEEKAIKEDLQPSTSIDQTQQVDSKAILTKDKIIKNSKRIIINTPSLKGSINLKGAIIDDLVLLKYNESIDPDSNYIELFSPDKTTSPYYVEVGWKSLSNSALNTELPNSETEWNASNSILSSKSPVTLSWINSDNIKFKISIEIDDNYLFKISQEIENNSSKTFEVFPYRLINRINRPETLPHL